MSDLQTSWKIRSASADDIDAGRYGEKSGAPGVQVERLPLNLTTVIASKKHEADVSKILAETAQVEQSALRFTRGVCDLIWSGPGQWLVAAPSASATDVLRLKLAGLAALTDQTDARAVLRVSGPRVRDVLAKGCPIDLHPRAFKPGDVALTSISHIGVHIWQVDEAPTFEITIPRSMIGSFWSWFDASAAEYGYAVS